MKKLPFFLLLLALCGISCSSTVNKIFGIERTPHEAYAATIEDSPAGFQWIAASEAALINAHSIKLPYSQRGYFHSDQPRALALQFSARRGERITFDLEKEQVSSFVLFADLFKMDGTRVSHLLAADTAASQFSLDIDEPGSYVLRLQPELSRTDEYNLSISTGPTLGFPVAGKKAKTGSFWGAERDGGRRSHEGIDIFAPKRTPAVAAADGYITRVGDGGIGGKTIWLRPTGENISLYYAHLDKHLVTEGQFVKKGDTVGLIGNTGNAKSTPPHLHFGIYTYVGAVDPYPFVNNAIKNAPKVPEKKLADYLKLVKSYKTKSGQVLKSNTVLIPLAVSADGYIAALSGGEVIQTSFGVVKTVAPEKIQEEAVVNNPQSRSKKS